MKAFIAFATFALVGARFKCPVKNGQYPDEKQCDKYWDCHEGEATETLCPDGLVFDSTKTRNIHKCDHPFRVDCGNRTLLQTPHPSRRCPRRNGFFPHPDASICDVYFNCVDGIASEVKCPEGLHFDEASGLCKWSYLLSRKGCNEPFDSFECPRLGRTGNDGHSMHLIYPHLSDCQKFYVCFNGITPRELTCPEGKVYNDAVQRCDSPQNVPGCEDWYKKSEEFEDTTDEIELQTHYALELQS